MKKFYSFFAFFALLIMSAACGPEGPVDPTDPKDPGNTTDPVTTKLKGSWRITNVTDGIPTYLIFQDGNKGLAYEDEDISSWFGLTLLEPTEFVYSIKNNNAVTVKLSTGTNINIFYDTNYQGAPILNFDTGVLYYEKTSDSTNPPTSDKKDEPFVKITKITDYTDYTITVECEVINSRILSLDNLTFGACAVPAGNDVQSTHYSSIFYSNKVSVSALQNNKYVCTVDNLNQLTSYDVYAFARHSVGSGYNESTAESYSTNKQTCTTKEFPGRGNAAITAVGEAVDLGLPSGTLWADRNIGASNLAYEGAYFRWGETSEQRFISADNYNNILSRDNDELKTNGIIDGNNVLTSNYDVATKNWGNGWRLPTKNEVKELIENCTWQLYSKPEDQMYGLLCFSKTNDNWIYLPLAGYYNYSSSLVGNTEEGYYLTSESYYRYASSYYDRFYGFYYLKITSSKVDWLMSERNVAFCARPVKSK